MGGWITSYLTEVGMSDSRASWVLSGFWIALMVARLITSGFVTPDIGTTVIAALALLAVITIVMMIMAKKQTMAVIGVLLTGLAFGPLFPTIAGYTFPKYRPNCLGPLFQ